jgi:hypothetical protein
VLELVMPTTNYDASRVSQRKRAVAMNSWNTTNKAAVNAGTSVRREQPDVQLGELLAYRNITKAYSTPSGVDACPCSNEIGESPPGGTNANNVQ